MSGRAGADRRLTFTQSPGAAVFVSKLAAKTGLPKSELYNTAMRALEVLLPVMVSSDRDRILQDTEVGLRVVLGDVLASFDRKSND